MAGHSKWSTIKRAKAKTDNANAKVFTKLMRELSVAVKEGGPDPSSNNKLKGAIARARSHNMPNDNISRTIKKASGELGSINYETIQYEGYGPGGSAVIVDALTDNRNRTAGDVRHYFDKAGGSLGQTGSVSFMFNKVGQIIVLSKPELSEDDITMIALESGAEDIEFGESFYKIVAEVESLEEVKTNLENQGLAIEDSMVNYVPTMTVSLDAEKEKAFVKMLDSLEDSDDVQEVYHNVLLSDEE